MTNLMMMLAYKVPNRASWTNSSTVQQWLGLCFEWCPGISFVFSRRREWRKREEWHPNADKKRGGRRSRKVKVLHCRCDITLPATRRILYCGQEFSASSLHTNATFLKPLVRLNQTFFFFLSFTFSVLLSRSHSLPASISPVLYMTFIILLPIRLVQIPVM